MCSFGFTLTLSFRYGVFALGDSSYPAFCGFGKWLDEVLEDLDGSRMLKVGLGDELGDRDAEFKKWSKLAFQQAALDCNLDLSHEQTFRPPLILVPHGRQSVSIV